MAKEYTFARLVAVLALLLVSVGVASAHAKLKSSVPAAGSALETAPSTVVAVFDNHDALGITGSELAVTDASGARVDQGDTALDKSDADRKTLTVSLKSGLGAGLYTVNWTAASENGDSAEEGSFIFTVGAATTSAPAQLPRTGDDDTLPLGLLLAGASVAIGVGATLRRRTA